MAVFIQLDSRHNKIDVCSDSLSAISNLKMNILPNKFHGFKNRQLYLPIQLI